MPADKQESCPRCHVGVLFVTRDEEDSFGVTCFHCGYGESRLKPGYKVDEPGAPITKAAPASKSKGDA